MKKVFFQPILIFALLASCKMQKDLSLGAVVQLKAVVNGVNDLETKDCFKLDAIVVKNSGTKWKTAGIGGLYTWNNLLLDVQNATFKNGLVYFDRKNLEGRTIKVVVKSKERPEIADSTYVTIPRITQIKLATSTNIFSPSSTPKIDCDFIFSTGKRFNIKPNTALWDRLKFQTIALEKTEKGFVWAKDLVDLFYNKAQIIASLDNNTSVRDTLIRSIDYSENLVFDASGVNGLHGRNGDDGYDGTTSEPNGYHAGSGGCGQNGFDAPNVEVFTKYLAFEGNDFVNMFVVAQNGKSAKRWLNITKGAKLILYLNGGTGGNGGNGGDGGDGIDGSSGVAPGYGGNGGNGGCAGYGGNAGIAVMKCDSVTYKKIKNIVSGEFRAGFPGVIGQGGKSGRGGYRNSPNLLQILFTGRSGSRGNDGQAGRYGKNGKLIWEVK